MSNHDDLYSALKEFKTLVHNGQFADNHTKSKIHNNVHTAMSVYEREHQWIVVNETWATFRMKIKAGMLLRVSGGSYFNARKEEWELGPREFLIGHFNDNGGGCNHCNGMADDVLVEAYKIVID